MYDHGSPHPVVTRIPRTGRGGKLRTYSCLFVFLNEDNLFILLLIGRCLKTFKLVSDPSILSLARAISLS